MEPKPLTALLVTFSLAAALLPAQSQPSASGLDLAGIDKAADPCNNFYQYACGAWMKSHPIPPDQSSWGAFDVLHERNQQTLRELLDESAAHQSRSPVDAQIGSFYASCMNEAAIEKLGANPLQSERERIAALKSKDDLVEEVARFHDRQINAFFEFGSMPDPKNAKMTIATVDQGGLGLPEKDFYFRTDERSQQIRQKYVAHIAKVFELVGVSPSDAAKKAALIMRLETDLARASLDVTARRDPQQVVHSMSIAELEKLSPQFNLPRYFTLVRAPEFKQLNVAVPPFAAAVSSLIGKESLDDLKDYLLWHYISESSTKLSKAFVDQNFEFYGKTLSGTNQLRPRWKRCVAATDSELGEALGRKYVEKTFGEAGKARTLEMVQSIETQMGKDIDSLSWLSPETKKAAQAKLKAVTNKIGYPDKWRDYSSIKLAADDYFGNWYRANEFEAKRQRDKVGKPVDRGEWLMSPPTVNAYYDPTQNNINFPAGILQQPFYSNAASDTVNYGAVGVVIGHELTHGFDDEGRQFDAGGNLRDWWTERDAEQFTKLAQCFVNEYGGFSPTPGVELNGKLTLGENTADNGGLRLAYLALVNSIAAHTSQASGQTDGKDGKKDGYTPDQQFFLGFAQVWCENVRPEQLRLQAQTDPHSPGEFRVNGVVQNVSQFGTAFGCKAGNKMQAAKACRVW